MTEVPEHLLARSRSRRSAMGGGGGDDAAPASTPATTSESAPAETAKASAPAVAAAAVPATPDPVAPWVEAAQTRHKIPVWAVPVLALLPLWGVVYALTLDEPTPTEPGAYELGAEVYTGQGCSGCHGAAGGGQGAVPALSGDNNPAITFERPVDMITWVALGTTGYDAAGIPTYGNGKPVGGSGGAMPAYLESLSAEQLMSVVLHERTAFGNDEEFDIEVWENGFEEAVNELIPDQAAEYLTVLEEWSADPPTP